MVAAKRFIPLFLYAACLLPAAVFAYRRPLYNWDMFGYMAVVLKGDIPNPIELHHRVYELARQNIPPVQFGYLCGSIHRQKLATDPAAFYQELPFYSVKPLYTGLVYLIYHQGISLPKATVIPSVVFYFFTGMLLFIWFNRFRGWVFSFTASILIMYSLIMVELSRLSTPDAVSTFLLFSAFYCLIELRALSWMFIFFMLSILARLDNVITAAAVTGLLALAKVPLMKPRYFALMVSGFAAMFFMVTCRLTAFGWNPMFFPSFIRYYDLDFHQHPGFSAGAYFALVCSKAATGVVFTHFTLFVFIMLLINAGNYAGKFPLEKSLAILLVATVIFRFLLFPDLADRFYGSFYLVLLVLTVKVLAVKASRNPGKNDA